MTLWEKILKAIKEGLGKIGEFIENAMIFAVALVAAPFKKIEDEKVPTPEELNEKYIKDVDKEISKNDVEITENDIAAFNYDKTENKINNILNSLDNMELSENGLSYKNALEEIYKGCEIEIDEDKNYVVHFPQEKYEGQKINNKGDLLIDKSIKFDKEGNFVSAEREYCNTMTHFVKSIPITRAELNNNKLNLFNKACKQIEIMKSQYQSTFKAKTYAENINRYVKENALTSEKVSAALEEMNVKLDQFGNIDNKEECNKFTIAAATNLVMAIRNAYKIENDQNLFAELDCIYNVKESVKEIEDIVKNIDQIKETNSLDVQKMKDLFYDYIGDASLNNPIPDAAVCQSEKFFKLRSNIVYAALNKIAKEYEIDKNENFFEAFKSRFDQIKESQVNKEEKSQEEREEKESKEEIKILNDLGEDERL